MPNAVESLVEFENEMQAKDGWTAVQILVGNDGSFRLWMARDALKELDVAKLLEGVAKACTDEARLHRPQGRA